MGEWTDLMIMLFFGISFSYFDGWSDLSVIAFLAALIISAYRLLYKRYSILSYGYLAVTLFSFSFLFYLPCIFYIEIKNRKWDNRYLLFLFLYIMYFFQASIALLQLFLLFIAWVLRVRYFENEELKSAYLLQRDNTKELALLLEEKNRDLLVRQEQEIKIATLNERNRIAREIHDHVGHLLSSSLLQIGALQAINSSEELRAPLQDLRATISKGMDNVRESVHDLHDDATDLQITVTKLCKEFSFCEASLAYDITHPMTTKQYYHILAIIKESMTNTMKHSNATLYTMTLREQPAFYQVILQDNGTQFHENTEGIGLRNIKDRVDALHGYCNISRMKGYLIFITIPKEEVT